MELGLTIVLHKIPNKESVQVMSHPVWSFMEREVWLFEPSTLPVDPLRGDRNHVDVDYVTLILLTLTSMDSDVIVGYKYAWYRPGGLKLSGATKAKVIRNSKRAIQHDARGYAATVLRIGGTLGLLLRTRLPTMWRRQSRLRPHQWQHPDYGCVLHQEPAL